MKTYKFSKTNSEFALELRQTIKTYFHKNNISTSGGAVIIVKTVLMSFVYFIPFIAILSGFASSKFWLLVSFFIMGLGMSALGMVTMHDANHNTFSKRKATNKFFSKTLYLLGGFPPNWQFQHNTLHHGYTNIEGHDEDIAPVGLLRFSPHQPNKKIHRYQHIYAWFFYGLMTLSWVTAKDFKRMLKYRKIKGAFNGKKSFTRLLIDLIISKILYFSIFLVLPIIFNPLPWYWIVGGFLTMHVTSGIILSTIFQTAHVVPTSDYPLPSENDEINNNWLVHQLYTTSDFSPNSKIFSWLIGGLNYQVIHHLFPNISHVHYKKLAPLVQKTALKYGLPYHVNRNFIKAVLEHAKMLKQLGNNSTAIPFLQIT